MIQNVFLPERFGTYYIFSQRIVGIDITKTHVHATLIHARGSFVSIEECITEPLNGEKENHTERVIETLTTVMKKIGKTTQINVSLPSSAVVFKEMRLPFTDYDKINMVIRFEVEPLLPFAPQDTIVDFIITDVNHQEQSSQVLVAATRKQSVAEYLSLFEQAQIDPDRITVDMFCLYGLYTQVPTYESQDGTVILLEIDIESTRLLAIHNKHLRIIRTLPHGMYHIAKNTSSAVDMTPQQVMDHLIRFGLEKSESTDLVQALQNSMTSFFNKIQFALNSTLTQLQNNTVTKIILLGPGAEIRDMIPFAHEKLQAPCELFNINKLTENKQYKINKKTAHITQSGLLSVATAIPSPITKDFNFRQGEFEQFRSGLLLKQLVVASVLLVILFGTLIAHSIIQKSKLKNELQTSQDEAVEELKTRFPEIPEDMDDFDEVFEEAKTALAQEESVWLAFSSQTRTSFLEYLLELSTRIDKQKLGFIPEQLIITDGAKGEIILKAKVRDFDELQELEHSLRQSKLFSYVEGQTTPDFTMKILVARNT